ncbi:MAG: pentapeptide repeat protein [Ilumatobacteraceae bacterium]|nr:pentapeptide repeat protein [Ilumatobacteraceae bacterium]
MTEQSGQPSATDFEHVDLTGASFRKVQLNDARFRMVDMSGARMRDVSLSGGEIDGAEIDGLRINGVEVARLIEAELTRLQPARSLRRSSDPNELRAAWAAIELAWATAYRRAAAMPAGTVDVCVEEEWSFAETVRHMVFVTDAWLGAVLGSEPRFHPWGVAFSDVGEFVEDVAALGVDVDATPSWGDVLAVRAERVARVCELLSTATPESLSELTAGPVWAGDEPITVLRCVWVVLREELEHLRFAERDLDVIEADAQPR